MGEAVVLLSSPGARLNVVDGGQLAAPLDLLGHLVELGILHHHRVHDTQKRLVAGKETDTAGECVSLHESLAAVLREDLNDTATLGPGVLVPLEVTASVVEDGIKLVALELVRREHTEAFGVGLHHLVEKFSGHLHAAGLLTRLDCKGLPVRDLEANVRVVCGLQLSELLTVILGNGFENTGVGFAVT